MFAVLTPLTKSPYKIYFWYIPYFMRVRKRNPGYAIGFSNPDFVKYAGSMYLKGYPIDYAANMELSAHLKDDLPKEMADEF